MQLDHEDTASPIQPVHMPTQYGKEVSLLQDFFYFYMTCINLSPVHETA
jgi:hypothetical protein